MARALKNGEAQNTLGTNKALGDPNRTIGSVETREIQITKY